MEYTSFLKEKIADLTGQVHVVTGANSGLGFFASKQLMYRGAKVILAVRHEAAGEEALKKIQLENPTAQGLVLPLDLASFTSIHRFVQRLKESVPHVDAFLLNAGVYCPPKNQLTEEGFPLTSGVNFFGPYYLLKKAISFLDTQGKKPTRIVFVGSQAAHRTNVQHVNDLLPNQRSLTEQYGQSKVALSKLFHAFQMNLNLFDFPDRKNISAILVHPGLTGTALFRHLAGWKRSFLSWWTQTFFPKPEEAALVLTFAMGHPYVVNGSYYSPSGLWRGLGKPSKIEVPFHFEKGSAQLMYDTGKLIQTKERK